MVRRLPLGHAQDLVLERLDVPVRVHADEGGELQESRIDHAADALVLEAHALDHRLFELAHGHTASEVGHIRGRGVGVDRAADQGQRARLRIRVDLGQVGGRGQRQRRGLTHGDHVGVGPEVAHEVHQVEGVILNVELAAANGDVARVVPVGDVDFAIHQERLHGGADECRVVPGHRGDQQDLARLFLASGDVEVNQVAERLLDHVADIDEVVLAVLAGERADSPVGLDHHAFVGAFRYLAPGGHPLDHRVGDQGHRRVGCSRSGRCAKPLAGITHRFHQIVRRHVAHDSHSYYHGGRRSHVGGRTRAISSLCPPTPATVFLRLRR